MTMVTPVKQIDTKTVCGKIVKPDAERELFMLVGKVVGFKTDTSSYGQWYRFTGEFEATNLETGEVFGSNKAFVPAMIQDMLLVQLAEFEAVDVAIKVGVKPTERAGGAGYEFTVKPLIEIRQSNALAHLREAVKNALPAPAKTKSKT